MKKSLWMFAAMTCGLALTSCDTSDNPSGPGVPPVETPTSLVFDFEDESLDAFTVADASKITAAVVDDEDNGTKVASFTRSGSSGFGFVSYTSEDLENATKLNVSFDFNIPAEILGQSAIAIGDASVHNATTGGFDTNSGQYGYGINGCIFYMGAYRGKAYGGGNENYFQINGLPAAASAEEHPATDIWGKWFHADIDVDVTAKTVSYTISTGDEVYFQGDTTFVSDQAQAATQLSLYIGYAGTYLLDNVKLTKVASDPSIKYANYTISYVDTEGNPIPEELKTTITRRAKVGEAIVLLDADKANFTNADGSVKYTYQSDNAEGATVTAAGTEIKIVYAVAEADKYKYRLNLRLTDADGTPIKRVDYIEGEQYEGQSTNVCYYIAYKDGDMFYVTPKVGSYEGRYFTMTGTETNGQEFNAGGGYWQKDILYTPIDTLDYIADFEDPNLIEIVGDYGNKAGVTYEGVNYAEEFGCFNGGFFDRFSNGHCIKLTEGSYAMTKEPLAGGTYKVLVYGRNDKSAEVESFKLGYVDAAGELHVLEIAIPTWGSAVTGGVTIEGVEIPAGCKLAVINDGGATSISLDHISITSKYTPTAAE